MIEPLPDPFRQGETKIGARRLNEGVFAGNATAREFNQRERRSLDTQDIGRAFAVKIGAAAGGRGKYFASMLSGPILDDAGTDLPADVDTLFSGVPGATPCVALDLAEATGTGGDGHRIPSDQILQGTLIGFDRSGVPTVLINYGRRAICKMEIKADQTCVEVSTADKASYGPDDFECAIDTTSCDDTQPAEFFSY